MKQEYLDHLFENYTGVENWHFTTDGTAFKNRSDAFMHARRLEDSVVKIVANGGKIENAVPIDEAGELLTTAEVENIENKEADLSILSIPKLREIAAVRNIDLGKLTKKNEIFDLIKKELEIQKQAENTSTENTGAETTGAENTGTENTGADNTGADNTDQ